METFSLDTSVRLLAGYNDRLKVKSLGAIPQYESGKFSHWVAPAGKNLIPFMQWLPSSILNEYRSKNPGGEAPAVNSGVRLCHLLLLVKDTLDENMQKSYWVVSEIVNVSKSNHVYLEMVDYDDAGNELAKVKGTIFNGQRNILNDFKENTGMQLNSGMKVLVKVNVQFHERYGLSLNIIEIDHRFTVGDMEVKLLKIKSELIRLGIFDLNRKKPLPIDFTSVAVIAPADAAGLGDFKSTADILANHKLCKFVYFNAIFQGNEAVTSIAKCLDSVRDLIDRKEAFFDACIIIRGGGEKSGLYSLNELDIASRVCRFPIPVIVGIGHERDSTIIDEVAANRQPTPSLVISYIESAIIQNSQLAKEQYHTLSNSAVTALHRFKTMAGEKKDLIVTSAKLKAQAFAQSTGFQKEKLISNAFERVALIKNDCKLKMTDLLHQDPKRVISKGYVVVRKNDGAVCGDVKSLSCNEKVNLIFRDGSAIANITQVVLPEVL
jgi:exodeoxyribonuclease VII large subunit